MKVFPALYPFQPNPYTPPKVHDCTLAPNQHRLSWYDVKPIERMPLTLRESLKSFLDRTDGKICIFTFCSSQWKRLQQEYPQLSPSIIGNIHNLLGQEYDYLWLILNKSHEFQPSLSELQLVLTRVKFAITVIGDWDYYQKSFDALAEDFHFVRDIIIEEP